MQGWGAWEETRGKGYKGYKGCKGYKDPAEACVCLFCKSRNTGAFDRHNDGGNGLGHRAEMCGRCSSEPIDHLASQPASQQASQPTCQPSNQPSSHAASTHLRAYGMSPSLRAMRRPA